MGQAKTGPGRLSHLTKRGFGTIEHSPIAVNGAQVHETPEKTRVAGRVNSTFNRHNSFVNLLGFCKAPLAGVYVGQVAFPDERAWIIRPVDLLLRSQTFPDQRQRLPSGLPSLSCR